MVIFHCYVAVYQRVTIDNHNFSWENQHFSWENQHFHWEKHHFYWEKHGKPPSQWILISIPSLSRRQPRTAPLRGAEQVRARGQSRRTAGASAGHGGTEEKSHGQWEMMDR